MRIREPQVLVPSIWMIIISLLLCWLPGFGPLIAGFVGGKLAGDATHALKAAFLPMIVAGIVVGVLFSFVPIPFLGVLAGISFMLYIAHLEIALIAGAVVGGLLAKK